MKYILGYIVNCVWSIDNESTKVVCYWLYWLAAFFTIGILLSWRMAFVRFLILFFGVNFRNNSLDNSRLWVASIFVSMAFDLLVYDPILIFLINKFSNFRKSMCEVIKYNGIVMKI